VKALGALVFALVIAGCSASRIENGVFYSPKGYQVSLPRQGWAVKPGGAAELELQRQDPAGGMLADATCDDKTAGRPLTVLTRHLTFGLKDRVLGDGGPFTLAGRPVDLTAREFELLRLFMRYPNRVFTRDFLLEHLWGHDFYGSTRTVDMHVSRLREKIEDDPVSPTYITTVRGVGYKFKAADAVRSAGTRT